MIDLAETFEKFEDEYIKFDRVESPVHPRPDLCAFIMLDKLVPRAGRDMVCAACHDEIYLDTDCEELAKIATEKDIETLVRCGVMYSTEDDSLHMFA